MHGDVISSVYYSAFILTNCCYIWVNLDLVVSLVRSSLVLWHILTMWFTPTQQCKICWLFVITLLVNIMLFFMPKSLYFNSCPTHSRTSTTMPQFSFGGNDTEFVDDWPHLRQNYSAQWQGWYCLCYWPYLYFVMPEVCFYVYFSILCTLRTIYITKSHPATMQISTMSTFTKNSEISSTVHNTPTMRFTSLTQQIYSSVTQQLLLLHCSS